MPPTPVENHNAGAADRYPNRHSYAMSGFSARGTPGNKLRRAVLYSAKKTSSEPAATGGIFGQNPNVHSVPQAGVVGDHLDAE